MIIQSDVQSDNKMSEAHTQARDELSQASLSLMNTKLKAAMQYRYDQVKDYESWQKSKMRRLNAKHYDKLSLNQVSPALQAILAYGTSSLNTVIEQMAAYNAPQSQGSRNTTNNTMLPFILKGDSMRRGSLKTGPSFVAYKKDPQKRQAILRLIPREPQYAVMEVMLTKKRKKVSYPRQLKELKEKLLPLIMQRRHSESNALASPFAFSSVSEVQQETNERTYTEGDSMQLSKKTHVNDSMASILLLSKQEKTRISIDESPSDGHVRETQEDFLSFMREPRDDPDVVRQFSQVIKEEQRRADRMLCKASIQEEKNSVWERYDQKMKLQKESYKRNVKALIQFRKAYRVEKQKEQIRANGIKRMKKILNVGKVNKNTNNPQQRNH